MYVQLITDSKRLNYVCFWTLMYNTIIDVHVASIININISFLSGPTVLVIVYM